MTKIYVVVEKHFDDNRNWRIVNDNLIKAFGTKQEAINYIENYAKDKNYWKKLAEETGTYRWVDTEHVGIIIEWVCKEITLDCQKGKNMIKIENTHVDNIARAVYSARNAMNSWDKSDSDIYRDTLGEKDLTLAKKLVKAGTDHSKFMRMINVTCDITAPLYWIAEHDTYKVGTTRNSCSFMHKGLSKPFSLKDFSLVELPEVERDCIKYGLNDTIMNLNALRDIYLETKDENVFALIRQMLPSGYNQTYTWQANYQVLRNIYHSRKNHRLKEWRVFCRWIETLPYSELITE